MAKKSGREKVKTWKLTGRKKGDGQKTQIAVGK
jgi:hypothetical protein